MKKRIPNQTTVKNTGGRVFRLMTFGVGQSISGGATTRISAANKTDVIAEHVELISKGQGHFHFVDLGLDVLKLLEHLFPLLGCGVRKHATLEETLGRTVETSRFLTDAVFMLKGSGKLTCPL